MIKSLNLGISCYKFICIRINWAIYEIPGLFFIVIHSDGICTPMSTSPICDCAEEINTFSFPLF